MYLQPNIWRNKQDTSNKIILNRTTFFQMGSNTAISYKKKFFLHTKPVIVSNKPPYWGASL